MKRTLIFILPPLLTGLVSLVNHSEYKLNTDDTPLEIGDTVENFTAKNQNDALFVLDSVLKNGPVVLVFYRGQWCPYCTKHLSNLEDSLHLITATGAQMVAISPEKSEQLQAMQEKTEASYSLLYDENYSIAKMFGVSFEPEGKTIKKYNTFLGADLDNAHQNLGTIELPVPATFIIDQNRVVLWKQYDPNYKNRSSVKDILDHLPG